MKDRTAALEKLYAKIDSLSEFQKHLDKANVKYKLTSNGKGLRIVVKVDEVPEQTWGIQKLPTKMKAIQYFGFSKS